MSCDCAFLILSQNWQHPFVWVRQGNTLLFGFVRKKKLKARVPLMPSHVFKYFFFIIRWPQFGVLHDPLSSLYTGLSARIHNPGNPWVSFCPPIDFLNHQMVILGHASHNTKTHILVLYPMISTRYTRKRACLHPLQRIPNHGRWLPLAI